ncbi:MAG TPA: MoaD/ThiS family protein [Candidatus Nanoarchaeia archaeon]|nr:MoaD/ThiS family protein [Candidatus Nanoarchaeia archaeon]
MVKVFIEKENKTVIAKGNTIKEILEKLNINPEEVLTVKNNELVTLETKISEKDSIKLLSVISGG